MLITDVDVDSAENWKHDGRMKRALENQTYSMKLDKTDVWCRHNFQKKMTWLGYVYRRDNLLELSTEGRMLGKSYG